MWKCLRLAETSECHVRVIKNMYDGTTTTVKCAARLTEELEVRVELQQGSVLRPFHLVIIMDKLTRDIRKEALWDMMFADDTALSIQSHRELENDLGIWRNALEGRDLKASRSKTEYLKVGCANLGEKLNLLGDLAKREKTSNIFVQQLVVMEDVGKR